MPRDRENLAVCVLSFQRLNTNWPLGSHTVCCVCAPYVLLPQIKTERITNENKIEIQKQKEKKNWRKKKKTIWRIRFVSFFRWNVFVLNVLFEMSTRNERETAYTNSLIESASPFFHSRRTHRTTHRHTICVDTASQWKRNRRRRRRRHTSQRIMCARENSSSLPISMTMPCDEYHNHRRVCACVTNRLCESTTMTPTTAPTATTTKGRSRQESERARHDCRRNKRDET